MRCTVLVAAAAALSNTIVKMLHIETVLAGSWPRRRLSRECFPCARVCVCVWSVKASFAERASAHTLAPNLICSIWVRGSPEHARVWRVACGAMCALQSARRFAHVCKLTPPHTRTNTHSKRAAVHRATTTERRTGRSTATPPQPHVHLSTCGSALSQSTADNCTTLPACRNAKNRD